MDTKSGYSRRLTQCCIDLIKKLGIDAFVQQRADGGDVRLYRRRDDNRHCGCAHLAAQTRTMYKDQMVNLTSAVLMWVVTRKQSRVQERNCGQEQQAVLKRMGKIHHQSNAMFKIGLPTR